jgi:YD repeat-containing protein
MPLSIKRRLTLAASVSLLFFLGGELPGSAQQAASFTYDQRGRLTVFVAPDGTITKYVYDAAGNISSIQRGTAADLMRIDSVTPNTGVVPGNTLTIVGQNFDPVASNNTVLFAEVSGSVPALVTGASATQLTVQVPQGAVTGAIRVQRLGQTVTGPVVTIQNLAIASISPTTPVVSGSTITLTGQGFSLNANGNTISFFGAGGTSIPVTVKSSGACWCSVGTHIG